jgi:hypothetical protein
VQQVAKSGAHLKLAVDGKTVERDFPAGDKDFTPAADQRSLKIDVPQGAHTITVENTGKDWVVVKQFSLSDYAPALAANARIGHNFAAVWVYHRGNISLPADDDGKLTPATGKLTITGLKVGRYRVTWWDTRIGKPLDETDVRVTKDKEKDGIALTTPPITRDIALYAVELGNKPDKSSTAQRPRNNGTARPGTPTTGPAGSVGTVSPTNPAGAQGAPGTGTTGAASAPNPAGTQGAPPPPGGN